MKNLYKLSTSISLFFVILVFNSCHKNDYSEHLSLSDTFEINLVKEDGKVKINWTLVRSINFSEYRIYRIQDPDIYNYVYRSNYVIKNIQNKHQLSYIDDAPVYLGTNYYWIEIFDNRGVRTHTSNMLSISISEIRTFNYFPVNVIFDVEECLLGFNSDKGYGNSFTLYNFERDEIIIEASIFSPHARPAFGKYNGNTELYFPAPSQRIIIYNASNMSENNHMSLPNNRMAQSIAAADNGNIYVVERFGYYLYALNRTTGSALRFWQSYMDGSNQMIYSQKLSKLLSFNNSNDWSGFLISTALNSDGSINDYESNSKWVEGDYYSEFRFDPRNDDIYLFPNVKKFNANNLEEIPLNKPLYLNDIAFCEYFSYLAPLDQKKIIKKDLNDEVVETFELKGYPINVFKAKDKLVVIIVENRSQWPVSNYHLKGYPRNTPFGIEIIKL
ncbi:hypothetical protein [Alkalitalea saponilacus]|uniref:Uncharacterized protein n=1 Tax=Alkalitalea saponilacus TaxID=889453 RepID=A0A1T5HTF7_9BACT|nr:hypothetical protein [Alkalitalea saponilacus]ASB49199.1 hypothetical protein CDL62_08625 [Alkalitalea saponilacus]SKC23975.1 hypothetical protein SAMN03080601_03263 [Alkalitalea saponilacus]